MARKNYKIDEVLRSLSKKHDLKILGTKIYILSNQVVDKKSKEIIPNPNKKWDLGNGSWGKIDFLVNYNGYRIIQISSFDDLFKNKKKQKSASR